MNIRYILETESGTRLNSIYSIEQLESGNLPKNLKLHKDKLNIIRRDLGTTLVDSESFKEVFENDPVIGVCSSAELEGILEFQKGSFFITSSESCVPLHKVKEIKLKGEIT